MKSKWWLQWGRNLTVAEGIWIKHLGALPSQLQWGRNLTVAEGTISVGGIVPPAWASMGPQLDSCGRQADHKKHYGGSELQWGRNLTVAEGIHCPSDLHTRR